MANSQKQDVFAETLIRDNSTRSRLASLLAEYAELNATISALESTKREMMETQIAPLADSLAIDWTSTKARFKTIGTITKASRTTRTIQAHKLSSHGVSQEVIDASTDVKVSEYYLVTPEKVKTQGKESDT